MINYVMERMTMSESPKQKPEDVAETLLITLFIRAKETERSDALITDEKAVALVKSMDYDFSRIKQIKMDETDQVTLILRNRAFDRYSQDFLARSPESTIVHIGCGLDSRFERVNNGAVQWYDLDLPEVIELRKKYIGDEKDRYHLLAYSVLDNAWINKVIAFPDRPFLFMAEGVFMYFTEAQVKSLVFTLQENFPATELIFDAFTPYLVRMNNLRLSMTKFGARYYWGLKRGKDLEKWGQGIRLIDEWSYFDEPEPRLASVQWMRHVPFLSKVMSIFHYQLG